MEVNHKQSCGLHPNVCRCCLEENGSWDLTMSYTTDSGIKEVYSDMIWECFGINLSGLAEWECSRLICGRCLEQLCSARGFRRQVLEAERQFLEHWRGNQSIQLTSIQLKTEDVIQQNVLGSSPAHSYDGNRENAEIQNILLHNTDSRTQAATQEQRLRKKVKSRRKIKKSNERNENDSDFDFPIAHLTHKTELLGRDKDENMIRELNTYEGSNEKHNECMLFVDGQQPKRDVKQVSERQRVILTCAIVLRDTSACPFRHHKSWFRCFFCSQDFMEINLLRNHTLQWHTNIDEELKNIKRYPRSLQIDISELKCLQCDLSLSDVEAMARHFELTHQKVIYKECIADYKVDASPYSCHLCKREFHVFRTLTTHLNVHYANCICDVCGKSFLNSKRLKVHKRTHENGSYPCTECGKVLKTKTSKANHMESAHSKRLLKCQICFKPMKHYNDRVKHMSEEHNITHKFKCSICDREYNIKHYLATHMRQTHGHKNKKCLECGMAFITNHGLKNHMLRHSGLKPYSCTVCPKSYVRSYTLREHMRVHQTEK